MTNKLTEATLIPMGIVASLAMTLAGAAWWASALYVRVAQAEVSISSLENSHTDVIKELREVNGTLIEIKTVLKRNK